MKKIFLTLALSVLAMTAVNAQNIYQIGDPENDKTMGFELADASKPASVKFDVTLSDPAGDACAISFWLKAPEGATWVSAKSKFGQLDEDRAPEHSFDKAVSKKADEHNGFLLVNVYNSDTESEFFCFQETSGTIITVNLDCSALADGNYEVVLVDPNASNDKDNFKCASVTQVITVANGAVTGINGVSADEEGATYFNASGVQQNGLQPGVNIVKYANGTTQKVYVK